MVNMDTLKLLRSQPSGDAPVKVYFQDYGGEPYGSVSFPARVWISFSKILQEGAAKNIKDGNPYPLKIVIEGFIPEKEAEPAITSTDRLIRTLRVEED